MRLVTLFTVVMGFVAQLAMAESVIEASSLVTCMDNSLFSASKFEVTFTPDNRTITYEIDASVEIDGKVVAEVDIYAYGINIISKTIDPCDIDLVQLCPLNPGQITISSHSQLSESVISSIPGVAYNVPDIDAVVYVKVRSKDTNKQLACIQADLTNRKTVNHVGVKWATAVIAGIGLLTSAVVSTLGSSYTAAHIGTNALMLFAYFQSVVIITMEAVNKVPPIAAAWGQNLAWSVGLIEVKFMQKIFRWYVAATGGSPTTYIKHPTISVLVQKRHQITARLADMVKSHAEHFASLIRRETFAAESTSTLLVLRGIKRVAYSAGIEPTAAVITAFTMFVFFCFAICLLILIVRGIFEILWRTKVLDVQRGLYFHHNWRLVTKGAVLRLVYIAFPTLLVFSFWEFVQQDSPAVIVLAVFFFLLVTGILAWNTYKVYVIGQRSIADHGTPAYMLYADGRTLNKYGFLYTQFDAARYWFIVVYLVYTFVKVLFIAFAQSSGKTQGLAIFLIELVFLVLVCWKRPYMDKSTNVINIISCVVMTLNAFFFLFFSDLFGQPMAVASIMGVIFFILNAAYALVLLIFTLVTCGMVIFSKNPDARFKPAKDDRASFTQEDYHINPNDINELTALGAAARADHESTAAFSRDSQFWGGNGSSGSLPINPFNEKHSSGASATPVRTVSHTASDDFDFGNDAPSDNISEIGRGHGRSESSTGLKEKF